MEEPVQDQGKKRKRKEVNDDGSEDRGDEQDQSPKAGLPKRDLFPSRTREEQRSFIAHEATEEDESSYHPPAPVVLQEEPSTSHHPQQPLPPLRPQAGTNTSRVVRDREGDWGRDRDRDGRPGREYPNLSQRSHFRRDLSKDDASSPSSSSSFNFLQFQSPFPRSRHNLELPPRHRNTSDRNISSSSSSSRYCASLIQSTVC
jgi:hypothetical protein